MSYYYHPTPDDRFFYSPDYQGAYPFHFKFDSPYNSNSTSWEYMGQPIPWDAGGYYRVSVDENPVFIRFVN